MKIKKLNELNELEPWDELFEEVLIKQWW